MILLDAHTHRLSPAALVSRSPGEDMPSGFIYSVGIHPWHATRDAFTRLASLAGRTDVAAIGETGLDLLRGPALSVQQELLISHIDLSEQLRKPLVLHCVRAAHLLLALRKSRRPAMPWMIHAFRGKPQQARQFTDAGFYLSVGPRFNPEALSVIPTDRLLIETDDADTDIDTVCRLVAAALGLTPDAVATCCSANLTAFLSQTM